MRTLIFGGDERQIFAAKYLKNAGYDADVFAIDVEDFKSARELYKGSYASYDSIVFPLPFSVDGININCPFSNQTYNAIDVLKKLKKNTLVLAGKVGSFHKNAASEFGLRLIDYYDSNAFQISNAVPTAEGAIWTLMNHSKKTVFGSRIAVSGCGKVGKCLADRLNKLGADISVAARNKKDIAWGMSMGMIGIGIDKLVSGIEIFDCIFNTVPCNIFDAGFVERMSKDTLYIELASKPYGMNAECRKLLGDRYIPAPSLPGKTAPISAGMIIGKTVADYL